MSAADRRVFVYPKGNAAIIAVLIGLTLTAMAVLLALAHGEALAWLCGLGILVVVMVPGFERCRPIAVSEERIEKRVIPENSDGEGGPGYELLLIRSGRRTITVHSDILEFAALKQRLTEKARRRGIALVRAEPQPFGRMDFTRLDELLTR